MTCFNKTKLLEAVENSTKEEFEALEVQVYNLFKNNDKLSPKEALKFIIQRLPHDMELEQPMIPQLLNLKSSKKLLIKSRFTGISKNHLGIFFMFFVA